MVKHSNALVLCILAFSALFCVAESEEIFLSESPFCLEGHFSALFLRPSSVLDYATEAVAVPTSSPDWEIFDIRPDFHFGFEIGVNKNISNANAGIAFDWKHLRSSHSAAHSTSQNIIGPLFEIGADSSAFKKAQGRVHFKFDEITVTGGQLVHFGRCLQTNLFAGVRFARIKQTLFSRFTNNNSTIVRAIEAPSRFAGTGPVIGFDFSYNLLSNLFFTGTASAAFLVGSIENRTDFTTISPALPSANLSPKNRQSTFVQKSHCVVPAFEDKIALAWYIAVGEQARLSVEGGFFITLFINALQSIDIDSQVTRASGEQGNVGVFAKSFRRTISNFALSGPYLTVSLAY